MWLAVLFGTFLTWIFCFIWTNTRDDWISRKEMKEESEISAADKALQAVANMVENALEWTIQGVGNISAIDSIDSAERASCGCLSKSKAKLPYDVDKVRRLAYVINIDHGLRQVQRKVVTLDVVNFNLAHNYVLYDDWIGDLVNITNDITMIYNGHRLTACDNGSLALIKKDRSDEQKSCIPGEVVQMLVSDVLSSHVKWEKEMPFKLRRLSRNKSAFYGGDSITCLVEKPVTVEVRWLMSPSSVEHPPKNIEKSDFNKFTKVDLSANLRIAADDRVRVKTTDEDEAITLTEYNKYLDDQYGNKFEQKVKPGNASVALKSSTSSIVKAFIKQPHRQEMKVRHQKRMQKLDALKSLL
ncbi:unnamed protein product, partial [Mesorhabditis belari]|uniref:Uncharacterized protein n=1 Tax=Mesorhabditis belari TaxID=2138241 RepID=A0AAF3ENC3_9BILA